MARKSRRTAALLGPAAGNEPLGPVTGHQLERCQSPPRIMQGNEQDSPLSPEPVRLNLFTFEVGETAIRGCCLVPHSDSLVGRLCLFGFLLQPSSPRLNLPLMRVLRQAIITVSTPMMFITAQFPVAETGAVAAVAVPS